ncbi:glycoside hydrolase family 140 protein [Hymenobacter sp. 5317J-9]|uniref:glycoside hydrolase family 140 protein n=1 Tax=Hymenobacter sp. 5317J-9 TaxID=2932250 RepID=UPI001FD6388C|nr:glycoside hydrolase family 140 protein [Hymenobacter sp. 5317J-9]UOQ96751.1 glycoside hydrolase family 140 protein [Hymenobacter sp. 5317J-9]
MTIKTRFSALLLLLLVSFAPVANTTGPLKVSPNGRYLMTGSGKPFFWLGDTGWLLFSKLKREEAETYLEDRRKKGFNVIQVMVLHQVPIANVYGDSAMVHANVARPLTTPGNSPTDAAQYDYWDHVDYIVDLAAKKGLYMGMVPVWGTNVKNGKVNQSQAKTYATFLAERYKNRPNIIWLNGGDIAGSDSLKVWNTIGATLKTVDPNHLETYHPRGRTQSSDWFHNASWLDFNMYQSGHRRYEQDTSKNETNHYGQDNWRYQQADYALKPTKPSLDGEPSYEGIPHGLHDITQPRWTDADVRRYGYWSVFAGAFGYTYGQNSVMQMHSSFDKGSAYGSKELWSSAIHAPGSGQMQYLKQLMLSRPDYFARVPDQSLIAGETGEKYNRLMATRGKNYAFVYTYNGRNMKVNMGKISGAKVKASWYSPRDGKTTAIGTFPNKGTQEFNPPGEQKDGNDWVLILDSIS